MECDFNIQKIFIYVNYNSRKAFAESDVENERLGKFVRWCSGVRMLLCYITSTYLFVFVDKSKGIIGHTLVVLNVFFLKTCIYIYLPRKHCRSFYHLIAQLIFSCLTAHTNPPGSSWKLFECWNNLGEKLFKLGTLSDVGRV